MGRIRMRIPGFCMSRVTNHVRVRSPQKLASKSSKKFVIPGKVEKVFDDMQGKFSSSSALSRKIMIVVDTSFEAKSALQWALSHTVQNHDTIVLLCVTKTSNQGEESTMDVNLRANELLRFMKNMCSMKKPEVQTEVVMVEGKEKGATIVEEAKKQGVSLLVLGQRMSSVTWRLFMSWTGRKRGSRVVDYLEFGRFLVAKREELLPNEYVLEKLKELGFGLANLGRFLDAKRKELLPKEYMLEKLKEFWLGLMNLGHFLVAKREELLPKEYALEKLKELWFGLESLGGFSFSEDERV
ncbi:hypothetical protein GIB67_001812 [Kingdonia uniflora]|uniref:UspA domain-containing protein n=1 Tax=Kingdonia uniflora TaxID=39325 RepID=A0A7J7LBL9_9MAGN|nr:hypothetical protein GIB67_001812 [Kingdonia uniflora]